MTQASHVDPAYTKTAKGQEAIATRSHSLAARMRSLLILVDGKRPQSALQALAAGFGDVPAMLAALQSDGFITSTDALAAPATARAPSSSQPAAAAGIVVLTAPANAPGQAAAAVALTLPQAKTFATRQLMQILGPTSDVLCLRVEAARNRQEFVEAIRRAYTVLADIRGRAQADLFGSLIEANLPPA